MGLTFLAPLFLAGLAAVGIPIYVHLTHRERKEPIAFPSLMFLQRVPFREAKRQRIRHWLLFALRAAAIVLLVAAFARPLMTRRGGVLGAGPRDVVILADRSYSMGYGDHWSRARSAMGEAIASLGAADRAAIVALDDRAEALTRLTGDKDRLGALVAGLRPGSGGTRYAPALQVARDLLDDPARRREVVLISDLQRRGWDGRADIRFPAGVAFRVVDVGSTATPNVTLAGAAVARSRRGTRTDLVVSVRVARGGGTGQADVPVSLDLDGRGVETRTVRLGPDAGDVVRFSPVAEPSRIVRARVSIPRDALPHDDTLHLVLEPGPRVPVLLVAAADAPAGEQLYLSRALAVGDDPAFPVTLRRPSQVTAADLEAAKVVVLHDAGFPSGDAGRRLRAFVAAGGGLLATLGPRASAPPADVADSVARAGAVADRVREGGAFVSPAGYDHPVMAPFSRPRSGDFAAARVFRYRPLAPAARATVLARFDDGTAAMVEGRWGQGRVILWATDFANRWNDLPLQAVFVPLVQQLGRHLGAHVERPAARPAGQVLDLSKLDLPGDEALVLERPGGERTTLEPDAARQVMLDAAGFWTVRPLRDRGAALAEVAVNSDPAESDLARLAPDELTRALAPPSGSPGGEPAAQIGDVQERSQGLWWYLLLGVLFLMAAETAVAHRVGVR